MEEKKLGKLKSFGILALALLIGLVLLAIFPFLLSTKLDKLYKIFMLELGSFNVL